MPIAANKERVALWLGCGIAFVFIVFAVFATMSNKSATVRSVYENIVQKKKALEQMRIHLLKSVDMEKNAVMALTDQQSLEYANQSRAASAIVGEHLTHLRSLIDAHAFANEKALLDEFAGCWTELGKIDQIILPLAVENTNLKAAQLSREPGAISIQRFEQALETLRRSVEKKPFAGQAASEVSQAMIAGLKIYTLHSHHIAEEDNGVMDQLEARMQTGRERVEQSLEALTALLGSEQDKALTEAKAAFQAFMDVTAQVVQLSRQNSNIKSLALSMGKKRLLAAKCDATLAAMQETVLKAMPKSAK